jgi:hypothetical protein
MQIVLTILLDVLSVAGASAVVVGAAFILVIYRILATVASFLSRCRSGSR